MSVYLDNGLLLSSLLRTQKMSKVSHFPRSSGPEGVACLRSRLGPGLSACGDLKSSGREAVWVRIPPALPLETDQPVERGNQSECIVFLSKEEAGIIIR